MDSVDIILIIISLSESILIIALTFYLYRVDKLQFVATLTSAFQDQWHSPRAVLMRDYLHSQEFEVIFNKAISNAYEIPIKYEEIDRILEGLKLHEKKPKLQEKEISSRFKRFDECLKNTHSDKFDYTNFPFSTYQALYEVLLSFDRLAIFRDEPYMMDKCIRRYKPPIRDLSTVMQAFIAVRIMLRKDKLKNYKKDYMHLLGLLSIDEPIDPEFSLNVKLFEKCKEGLKGRKELSYEEQSNWEYIIEKRKHLSAITG